MWPFCRNSRNLRRLVREVPRHASYFPFLLELSGGITTDRYGPMSVTLSPWIGAWCKHAVTLRVPTLTECRVLLRLIDFAGFFSLRSRYRRVESGPFERHLRIGNKSVWVYDVPRDSADPPEFAAHIAAFDTLWDALEAAYGVLWTHKAGSGELLLQQARLVQQLERLNEIADQMEESDEHRAGNQGFLERTAWTA